MARKVNRKELCEAIRQSQARMQGQIQDPVNRQPKETAEPVRMQYRQPKPRREKGPKKPLIPAAIRQLQMPKVRVQPRYLAAAAAGVVFVVLVVLLAGRMNDEPADATSANQPDGSGNGVTEIRQPSAVSRSPQRTEEILTGTPAPAVNPPAIARSQGDHVVVIATYVQRDQLEPVAAFFEANGIETRIMKSGSHYLLMTEAMFEWKSRELENMLQRVRSVGAEYKAPAGYMNFGKATFSSAYAKKIKQ